MMPMWESLLDAALFLLRDALWDTVLFQLGRAALLAITLGRFPRGQATEHHSDLISLAGVAAVVLAWLALAWWNHAR
jgi:hypothetical protein